MMSVTREEHIPPGTLIAACRPDDQREQTHLDCYTAELAKSIDLREFVEAFYTTVPFRIERRILAIAVKRPSTSDQARALAAGDLDRFSAWTLEARNANEILMRDMAGSTKSWLMVEPISNGKGTRLYFGTVLVAPKHPRRGTTSMGWAVRALMPVHGLYSRLLLGTARARLARAG